MKKILFIVLLCSGISAFADDLVTERHSVPYKGEKELDVGIEFGLGELELRGNDNDKYIMQAEISYSKNIYRPEVRYQTVGDRGKLKLISHHDKYDSFWSRSRKGDSDVKNNHWRVAMTKRIPTAYSIELGLGRGILDFTDIRVSDLSLECGLSDVQIEFAKSNPERIRNLVIQTGLGNVEATGLGNTNTERLSVESGLGSTKLRFDGESKSEIKGRLTVGLGSVTIEIPRDYAVQIEAESSFLSSLNFNGFREVHQNIYRSKNWKNSGQRIYLIIEIGLGSVDIRWID